MPAVISDTTALNCLARIDEFGLLRLEFRKVLIPPAVFKELKRHPDLPGASAAQRAAAESWLEIRAPQNPCAVDTLQLTLGAGEAEVIVLAREFPSSFLLMDEADGRAVAERLKLNLIGTTGVLVRARKANMIPKLKPPLDKLIQRHGFRLSRKIYENALREAGEME